MASDSDNSYASPEKRLKALIPLQTANTISKVGDDSPKCEFGENQQTKDETSSLICVICFSEGGIAERGKLDSCDHYFCFVCIMEWARIESRCPACKGRFTAVHRIPRDGCLLLERIIKVPIRNQVHSSSGNTTSEPYDPYSETVCTVCKGIEDEALMLLCDLCDSAAHTYCVGLGANVPESDWFCHDCTISRDQHAGAETETGANEFNQMATVEAHISISDIVQESSIETSRRRGRRALSQSKSVAEAPSTMTTRRSCLSRKLFPISYDKPTGTSARTLRRCRNIHGHIRALRENWGALQRGSLNFPSSSSIPGGKSSKDSALNNHIGQPYFSTTRSFQQPSKPESNKSPCDVEKAWKMMEIAKSVAIREGKRGHDQTLRRSASASRENNIKGKNNTSPLSHEVKSLLYEGKEIHKPVMDECSLKKGIGKQKCPEMDKQLCCSMASKKSRALATNEVLFTTSSSNGGSFLSCVVQTSQGDFCNEIGKPPSLKSMDGTLSSSKRIDVPKKGLAHDMSSDQDTKSEIRTLVKINLKLLRGDKILGCERFKKVARLATHTIMAACGLEPPPESTMGFFSTSVCSHAEDVRQLHRSTLMSNSCRECFFIFVRNVINKIISEKLE